MPPKRSLKYSYGSGRGGRYAGTAFAQRVRRISAQTARRSPAGRMRRRNVRTAGYLGIELKFLDTGASSVALGAPTDASGGEIQPEFGCTSCLSAPAQGDGESNRDGRKIVIKSMLVNGAVLSGTLNDQADAINAPQIFVALVLDKQANGATIVSEQVFTNPNDSAAVNAGLFRNLEYAQRYQVVDSAVLQLGPFTGATDGANTSTWRCPVVPFKLSWNGNLPVEFTGTTADVANVTNYAFHVIAFATNLLGAGSVAPLISYNARCRFVG